MKQRVLSLFVGKCLRDGSLPTEFILIHHSLKKHYEPLMLSVPVCVFGITMYEAALQTHCFHLVSALCSLSPGSLAEPHDTHSSALIIPAVVVFRSGHFWSAQGDNVSTVQSTELMTQLLATG